MESKRTEKLMNETKGFYMLTTLRTCFDPASDEWEQTTLPTKVEILKKFMADGNALQDIIIEYRAFYIEMKKIEVAKQVTDGLIELLNHLLHDQAGKCAVAEG